MGAPQPTYLPEPFANDAAPANINVPIPDAAPGGALASWQLGFPPVTMQAEIAGGQPPYGQDFNGILFTITSHIFAQQAGQPYTFNATLSAALTGYAAGAMLGMADGSGFWLNTQGGNTVNPDTAGSADGWVPGISYGITIVPGLTGGLVTLTPAQTRRGIIILQGALISNLQIVLPNTLQQWLIVNQTTGGFSTTVKTAAGTGVIVPPGGSGSPVGVWGDGTNIYPTVAPLAVAIDQNPTPLTLVERTNLGYIFGTYFNQTSAAENPVIANFIVDAGDGFFRKISVANMVAQLFGSALTANSIYQKLPSGLILQVGKVSIVANSSPTVVFPVPFPNACVGGWASVPIGGFQPGFTPTNRFQAVINGNAVNTQTATWFALGY